MMYSLYYRVQQENLLINLLKDSLPTATIIFDQRAAEGIKPWRLENGLVESLEITDFESLDLPSWYQTSL